ncbi:MAG: Ig-like domain-containing protein [Tannerellaceae bacterium]|jgi:uncharacterized protein YjdB|nr:Ig-like domain-containing protein [Tannerellaceae bacterium]
MKKLSVLSLLLSTLLFGACTTEIIVLTGSISGVVQDAQTKQPLENVSVALSPVGLSKVTGKDGSYFFEDLTEKEYTLTYTKPEYISASKESKVQARVNNVVDVTMEKEPIIPVLAVSDKSLDFGEDSETLSLYITNTGNGELKWSIKYEPGWFVCSPLTGTTAKEKSTVVVTASRNQMQKGSYQQTFSISSNGGSQNIAVTMKVVGVNLEYAPLELDFGKLTTSLPLQLTNKGTNTINYTVETSNNWIIPEKTSGRITTTDKLNILVSRESLSAGNYTGSIILKSGNDTYAIPVKMSISSNSTPVVSINPVGDITSTGATFSGVIEDVGRSEITKHGFCLSTSPEPTIEDRFFNLGDCNVPKSFTQIVTDLEVATEYFVRAYAENANGHTYSTQLSFSTLGIPVTGVSLNKASLSLIVGSTEQLYATVSPSNALNKTVSWASSNTSVATVSATGLVTAVAAGSATITVTTADGGKTAGCNVSVTVPVVAVTAVSLNKTSLSLGRMGATEQLTTTITPSNASNKQVTWHSNNTSVATVSATGLVTAVAEEGSATITVTTVDGNRTASCSVTVRRITVTSVSLDKSSLSMEVGNTQQLTATIAPPEAPNKQVTWISGSPSVATVSATGLVTAVAEGSTTITVQTEDGNKTATCSVTVEKKSGTTASLTWRLSNGTLTISGNGPMPHYSSSNRAPWSSHYSNIVNVVIENGVTNIGNYAFCDYYSSYYYYTNLKSVTISNTVTKIGEYAFRGSGLESVTIPNSVTSIEGYAFYGCKFTTLVIPDNVTTIGDYAFSSCSSLYNLTIGASVGTIGNYAFRNCYSLTSVSVKNPTPPDLYYDCSYYDYYSFSGIPIDVATLTVPNGSKAAYQSSVDWKCFGTIVEAP